MDKVYVPTAFVIAADFCFVKVSKALYMGSNLILNPYIKTPKLTKVKFMLLF